MTLCHDVLVAIMSCLDRNQLVQMMHACSALYDDGTPYLLRPPVVLRSRQRVLSFCRYVLIEPTRFRYLRRLEIRAPGQFAPGKRAFLFLAMLTHAAWLEDLLVLDSTILLSDEQIPAAVAALTSLKSISFPALNTAATEILQNSLSSLTKVEIGFWSDETTGPGDPIALLSRFTHSLRELRVIYAEFTQQIIQYPHVTILVIDDSRFALAEPLILCFPHMRDLSLWTGQDDEDLEIEEIEEHRQTNIQAQTDIGWRRLDHLRGDIRSLYLLGITCPIGHLDVHSTFLTTSRVEELETLLSYGHPSMMSLRFTISGFDGQMLNQVLQPAKDSLAHLIIYFTFYEDANLEDEDHANRFATSFCAALNQTSITELEVYFSSDDADMAALAHLNLQKLVETVVENSPCLQNLSFRDLEGHSIACWKVLPGGRR